MLVAAVLGLPSGVRAHLGQHVEALAVELAENEESFAHLGHRLTAAEVGDGAQRGGSGRSGVPRG